MALSIDPNPVPARICTATTDDPALSRYAKVCKIWHTQLQEYVEENPFEALTFPRNTNIQCAFEQLVLLNASIADGNIEGARLFGKRAMTCFHGLASIDIDATRGDHLEVLQSIGDAAEVIAYGALIAEAVLVVAYFAPWVLIGGTGTSGTVGGSTTTVGALAAAACADIEYDTPFDPDGGDAVGGDGVSGDGSVEDDGAQAGADQVGVDQAADAEEPMPEFWTQPVTVTKFDTDDGCTNPITSFNLMYLEQDGQGILPDDLTSGNPGDTVTAYIKRGEGEAFSCELTAFKDSDSGVLRWNLACATTLRFETSELWITPNNVLKIWGEWDFGNCSTTGKERL